MNALLASPFAYHLGWTLVHFLWQGLLLGGLYACLRSYMADASPQARYLLSLSTLAMLAFAPVLTLIYLMGTPQAVPEITGFAASGHLFIPPVEPNLIDSLREMLHPFVPWTVPAWSVGVALLGFKAFVGWRRARTLTRQASHSAPAGWQDAVSRLAAQVGVRMRVRLLVTARVAVPCVVGCLKPVILLPPAALTGLTPLQLEMVLAHELSHIRRHDYLVNLVQVGIETLLFYHPVVRWVSRDARRERELCCDDSAVHACGDALHYAHALTDLAALRGDDLSPAMGVTGGDLAMRVERLITPHHAGSSAPRLTSMMLATALGLGSLLAMASARHMPAPLTALQRMALPAGGIPSLQAFVRSHILPTQVQAEAPRSLPPLELGSVSFGGSPLVPVVSPAPPEVPTRAATAAAPPAPKGPVQIGGKPLSTLLQADDGNPGITANRRATAPIKFINMNDGAGAAPSIKSSHDYCQPITGSRVCS